MDIYPNRLKDTGQRTVTYLALFPESLSGFGEKNFLPGDHSIKKIK